MRNNQLKSKNNLRLFLICVVSTLLLTTAAFATDGDLDTSFDGDGRVVTDFLTDDNASEIVQLPDGKLLVYGLTGTASRNGFARYNTDGTLDATFGTGGKVVLDQPQGMLNAVKVQPAITTAMVKPTLRFGATELISSSKARVRNLRRNLSARQVTFRLPRHLFNKAKFLFC